MITGASGMVGKGVLLECLDDSRITKVVSVGRRMIDNNHPKLIQEVHKDFTDFQSWDYDLSEYDACYHNMGVSSLGKSEEEFSRLTYDVTKSLADKCYRDNRDMVFVYVSGEGTDSSEQGSTMWARVKGKTENYILSKGFKDAYIFRPGAIIPENGIRSSTWWYQIIYDLTRPFHGWLKKRKNITTTTRIGQAMINILFQPSPEKYPVNQMINKLSQKV